MKTFTSVALFSLINGIAAYPAPVEGDPVSSCQPGHLVCQGESQFGVCNSDGTAFFMGVSQGTKCVCSGSDCSIIGVGDGGSQPPPNTSIPGPSAPQATQSTSQGALPPTAPAAPSTPCQGAPPASSDLAPVPTKPSAVAPGQPGTQQSTRPCTSKATASSPQATASSPAVGGQFKETSTSTRPISATSSAASSASPSSSAPASDPNSSNGTYVKTFLGKGDAAAGWPQESSWQSFDALWDANLKNVIGKSCTNFQQENNSPAESAELKSAIEKSSKSSGVDPRFVLAVVMQESNGCVRAPTTENGVVNPGLMQSHNGANSCFNVNPCPKDKIQGMIEDGVNGTADGDGLKQLLGKAGESGATTFYRAARMYNSGAVDPSGDLEKGIATHCYASDIANRLIGWTKGNTGCRL
ncbi:hypothetical protein MY11210_001574 [Beauveria gryllotalpidicola]